MKLLIKLALAAIALVVLLVVGIVIAAVMLADRATELGIEQGGTWALGVRTSVDAVELRPMAGTARISGLEIANPEGFDTPYFVHLGEASAAVAIGTLWSSRIELSELSLSGLSMHLDRKHDGANYDQIVDSLKRFESTEPGEPSDAAGERDVLIRRIVIREVEAHVQTQEDGGDLSRVRVPIDEITLENVSLRGDNTEIFAKLSSILTQAVFAGVLAHAAQLPAEFVGELGAQVEGLVTLDDLDLSIVGGTVGTIGTGAGNLLQGIGEGIEGAAEEIGKGIGELLGGSDGGSSKGGSSKGGSSKGG